MSKGFMEKYTKEAKAELLTNLLLEFNESELDETAETATMPLGDTVDAALKRLENPDEMSGLPSGLSKIDFCLRGFGKQELIVVAGQTFHGKSLLVQNIILTNALAGHATLFYTLEMSPVENTVRFLDMAKHYHIDTEMARSLPIYYADMGGSTSIELLEELTKEAIELNKIEMLVIDHLHFFARSRDNVSNEISTLTKRFKELARNLDIPVILVSHVRRLSDKKSVPGIDDLMNSASIGQDADTVLMIWRDMESQDEIVKRQMTIRVLKNRRAGLVGDQVVMIQNDLTLTEVNYANKSDS